MFSDILAVWNDLRDSVATQNLSDLELIALTSRVWRHSKTKDKQTLGFPIPLPDAVVHLLAESRKKMAYTKLFSPVLKSPQHRNREMLGLKAKEAIGK